jgi:hypothetical protein
MSTINPVHTSCKNCVFAVYEQKTQTGCAIKYLDKYKEKTEVLEAYDNDKEFYVINDKKCLAYREAKFFKNLDMEESSIQDKIKQVLDSNYIDYALLVDLKYFTEGDLENLVEQINSMSYKPKKIIFIRYQNDQKSWHGYEAIKTKLNKINQGVAWRIQTMVNDDSYYEILHNVVSVNKKHRFFYCIEKPVEKINSIVDKANSIVYQDLDTFFVIANSEKTALLFSGGLYRYSAVVNKINLLKDQNAYTIV